MTERTCDGYGLSVKGLEGVTFCRKAGAQIVGELVQDLRAEVAALRSPDRWRLAEETAQGLLAIERGRTQQLEATVARLTAQGQADYAALHDALGWAREFHRDLPPPWRAVTEIIKELTTYREKYVTRTALDAMTAEVERLKTQLAAVSLSLHQNTEPSAALSLRQMQARLPWTIPYSPAFVASPEPHRNLAHDVMHVMKSLGRIATLAEDFDHGRPPRMTVDQLAKELADLPICAMHMAKTNPLGAIDLHDAVVKNSEMRNEAPGALSQTTEDPNYTCTDCGAVGEHLCPAADPA